MEAEKQPQRDAQVSSTHATENIYIQSTQKLHDINFTYLTDK